MSFASFLRCPLCGGALTQEGRSLFCDGHTGRRHCYDIAREGYVNLLPPGKKNNAHTGDDAGMITARTAFLSGGYYDCISDAAADACLPYLTPEMSPLRLLDAGSGEGYHTCRIASRLAQKTGRAVEGCGADASKKGAAAGAKRASALPEGIALSFITGNIFALPTEDRSLDVMFSLFAPIPAAEAMRTLKDDGVLVVVASAPRHLWEMRCLLYDDPREGNAEAAVPEGFILLSKNELRTQVHIPSQADLDALFTMTPFYYRTPAEGRERLAHAGALTVCVEADVYVFRKIH
ncbi:MAG: methyltransferase domain-containing protein [Clostridia bacterium]|nr:methyltransferase domain-containing protein [Clostridia bacterium]